MAELKKNAIAAENLESITKAKIEDGVGKLNSMLVSYQNEIKKNLSIIFHSNVSDIIFSIIDISYSVVVL